jgi:hypothetical protein
LANDHQVIDAFGRAIPLPWRFGSVLLAHEESVPGNGGRRD